MRGVLARAVRAARELERRVDADPLNWLRWLPVQDRYLRCAARFRLLRAGNQSVGKSTVGLADLAMDGMGIHPYGRNSPIPAGRQEREYWLLCASWSQSVNIQAKLHALVPPDRLHPETRFDPVKGYRGRNPAVRVRHEDGSYSIIKIKTTRQGTLDLAGAGICGALFDEVPTSQAVYSEVVKRVQASGGWVSICATMVGAPVDWLRDEAENNRIEDLHTRLTPEALIPIGCTRPIRLPDGTLCDADWIAKIESETPPHEREVRIHGGWEIRLTERYFAPFISDPATPCGHVNSRKPQGQATLCIGIDHGSKPGKQIALLVAVQEASGPGDHLRLFVLDEYCDTTGQALPEDDARGILDMLDRNGLKWGMIDFAGSDRVHMPGSGQQKSARDLQVAIARHLRIPPDSIHPPIRTVKRGSGRGREPVRVGCRWLYHQMVRENGFNVHPRCTRLIEALDRWAFADDDNKDPIDALRYALDRHIFRIVRGR